MTRAIPEGMHALTPQLTIDGAERAIEWYKKALGAEVTSRFDDPVGKKVMHAALRVGDSTFFVNDTFPEMGAHAHMSSVWVYGDEVDRRWQRAVDAGAKPLMPLGDQFWGDRMGTLTDPFGNRWTLAQRIKEMSPEEMKRAGEAMMAQARAK